MPCPGGAAVRLQTSGCHSQPARRDWGDIHVLGNYQDYDEGTLMLYEGLARGCEPWLHRASLPQDDYILSHTHTLHTPTLPVSLLVLSAVLFLLL